MKKFRVFIRHLSVTYLGILLLGGTLLFCSLSTSLSAQSINWLKVLQENQKNLEILEGGYTNDTFTLMHQGKKYIVKHLATNAAALGVNRALEFDFQKAAAARGLSSNIYYISEKQGLYVADYLKGAAFVTADLHKAENLVASIRLIKELHKRKRFKVYKVGGQLLRRIHHFMEQLPETQPSQQRDLEDGYAQILRIEKELPQAQFQVASHNDYYSGNIIHHEGLLKVIDWEYAEWASPYNDLTLIAVEDFLPEASHETILETYFEHPTQKQRELFKTVLLLQRFMVMCWYSAQLSRGLKKSLSQEYQQRYEKHLKVFQNSIY